MNQQIKDAIAELPREDGLIDRERLLKFLRWLPKGDILDALCENEPEITRGALRGWLNRNYTEPKRLPRTCPKCKDKTATTTEEIGEHFGYRLFDGGPSPQSYCRGCR